MFFEEINFEMESSTVQVTNLDASVTDEKLEEIFSDFGPLTRFFVVKAKKPQQQPSKAIVQFANSDYVNDLLNETQGRLKYENLDLSIQRIADKANHNNDNEAQRQFDKKAAQLKKSRLIVRNLSFKATEEKLRSHFANFGELTEVNILKKRDGKMVGCAFVQFSTLKEAGKAIKELNGKPFLQRPIAVDWAVPKEQYQQENPKKMENPESNPDDDTQADSDNEPDSEDGDSDNEDSGHDSGHEDSNEDSGNDSEDDDVEDSDGDAEDSDDDAEDSDNESEGPSAKRPRYEKGHDISENKTVFVRNISFNSDQDDLKAMFEDNFGQVLFARLVIDKATEHPKGTAFVKFADEQSVAKCIEASQGQEGLWLDNRQIYVDLALKPDEAKTRQVEKSQKKEEKDNRNLYLAREGLVREGTQAAFGVSKSDLQLRVMLEKRKKEMLKDLSKFISPTRLCIRNIPQDITDKSLRSLILKHVKDRVKINELRVMKDLKSGKNKGFAFVAFLNHSMALTALRALNNNPDVFRKDQRPIVEFSIESTKALNARQKRLEKSREKNPNCKDFKKTASSTKKAKNPQEPLDNANEDISEEKAKFAGSLSKKGQKGLPTHTGAKIRHKRPVISRKEIKKREKAMKNPQKRKAMKVEQQPSAAEEGGNVAKKAKKAEKKAKKVKASQVEQIRSEKKFDAMVQDYKKKLMSGINSAKKQKWYTE